MPGQGADRLRKNKAPERVNPDRWLVSYADFVTLLFALFTTMYAISTVDAQKLGRMVLSMRASFNSTMFPTGSDALSLSKGAGTGAALSKDLVENVKEPDRQPAPDLGLKKNLFESLRPKGMAASLGQLQRTIDAVVAKRRLSSNVRTRLEDRGLVISLDGTFYDSGDDQLRPKGRELMDAIAPDILALGGQVRVEGHADSLPIHTERFPTNIDLSCARASSVVIYLVQNFGFRPEEIYPAGWGESRPIADNKTTEGRALNRRVEIIVLSSVVTRSPRR